MELEKEVRYSISDIDIVKILNYTFPLKEKTKMIDITFGYDGFNSLKKNGYICRVRQKGNKYTLEVKNYKSANECLEQSILLNKLSDGINYLKLINMKPYLYLERNRTVRKYNNLKIFIDEFDILGNYVEIEYQDSLDGINELNKFLDLIGINKEQEGLYGDIVKEKINNDVEFNEKYNKKLNKVLNNLK